MKLGILTGLSPAANTIRVGYGVPLNTLGVNNDYYIDKANEKLYKRTGGVYVYVNTITGIQNGATLHTCRLDSGVPSNSLGVDNDYYIDTNTSNIYQRVSGVYNLITNLKHPTGYMVVNPDDDSLGIPSRQFELLAGVHPA